MMNQFAGKGENADESLLDEGGSSSVMVSGGGSELVKAFRLLLCFIATWKSKRSQRMNESWGKGEIETLPSDWKLSGLPLGGGRFICSMLKLEEQSKKQVIDTQRSFQLANNYRNSFQLFNLNYVMFHDKLPSLLHFTPSTKHERKLISCCFPLAGSDKKFVKVTREKL
jgi:hypothetical protein